MTGQSSSSSDIDFFKLYASGSGTAQFSLTLPSNNYSYYYVKIYDALGALQKSYTTQDSATYSVVSTSAGYSYISVNSNSTADYSINGSFSADKVNTNPTYLLRSDINTANEGFTATFTLSTTNVSSGTQVPYTLSGVSASDVSGGLLSGNAVVNTSGVATISVTLLNDSLTEGTETLTVTAGGASASTQINDTSRSASPTYSISTNWTSTTEGTPIVATLSTTNVVAGTTLYYELSGSGLTTSDFGGLSLTGSSVINSLGQASLTIPLSADATTEGNETFVIQYYIDSGRSTAAGSAAYVTIQDTSKGAVTPTYAVSANRSSVNEGSTADFTITTSNVSAETSISYTLSGVSSTDITGGALTGFATVNSSGTALVSVPIAADNLTEGSETLTISLQSKTASILINDTSKAAAVPTYDLVALSSSVNEGSVASFSLTSTGVSPGTSIAYTISGVSSTDVTGGLSGTATVDINGLATISVPIAADFLTEGTETLTVTTQGKSTSVLVNDTSKTTLVASYALSASTNSVFEGSNAVFTLTTTNVAGGTSIPYTISGVSSGDLIGGALSGSVVVNSSGTATISIPILNDGALEGEEKLLISANGAATASISIVDTSSALITADTSFVNEGTQAKFTIVTKNILGATNIEYSLSGISAVDLVESSRLSGMSGKIDGSGIAVIWLPIATDNLTEGDETLTISILGGSSAQLVIKDTSAAVGTATYILFADAASFTEGSNASFNLTTTNLLGGSTLTYTIEGVSSEDIVGGALSGTLTLNANGFAAIQIPIANDLKTEGTETLTIRIADAIARTFINDTSVTPNTTLTSIPYGNGQFYFTTLAADKVTGTNFIDVVKQFSTLSATQLTKNNDGSWLVQNKISPTNSDTLVNVERIEFNDITVALDVSGPAGQVAKILGSVFGKSYVSNTEFAGIGFAYLDGGMSYLDLCGLAAGAAGLSTPDLLVTTLLRNTTGTEPTALSKSSYLQSISSGASYASVVQQIADSSANAQSIKLTDLANTGLAYTPYVLPPTYSLSASTASVNEGSTAVFNLTTTNVAVGAEVSYTISGVSPADLTTGITGKVTVGAGGAASISVPIAADGVTEGQETLTVNAQGASAAMVINDTSKGSAAPTYTLTPATLSVNEGELARVYVNTTNVAAGTMLQYGVSGVSSTDLIGDLTRQVSVDSLGQALINIQTIADQTTEGPETMYITLGTSTTSFIINDTSVTLVGVIDNGGGDGGGAGAGGGGGGGD